MLTEIPTGTLSIFINSRSIKVELSEILTSHARLSGCAKPSEIKHHGVSRLEGGSKHNIIHNLLSRINN
jgi:hypothetical protein